MQRNDPPAIKANAKDRVLIFSVFAAAIFGWGASYVFRTTEISGKECYVYKVANTPVTAFVLKPPELTSPAAEVPKCPAAPKCEEKPEEKIEEIPTQEKPKTQKHRHRHRVRARWGKG